MPSQEEYLDNLLKDIMQETQELPQEPTREVTPGPLETEDIDAPSLEASGMAAPSLEELMAGLGEADEEETLGETGEPSIEELLRAAQEEGKPALQGDSSQPELAELLGNSDDSDLKEIGDMLQKADNNEPVSQDIVDLLEEADQPQAEAEAGEESEAEPEEKPSGLRDKLAALKHRFQEKRKNRKTKKKSQKPGYGNQDIDKNASNELQEYNSLEDDGSELKEDGEQSDVAALLRGEEAGDAGDALEIPSMDGTAPAQGEGAEENSEELAELLGLSGGLGDTLLGDLGDLGSLEDLEALGERPDYIEEKIKQNKHEKEKKGFFARILDFLTEEDEPEEQGEAGLILSDENDAILRELNKEQDKKKKNKKDKKAKPGNKPGGSAGGEEDGEDIPEKKPAKAKKPPKQKKVKKPEPVTTEKKLSKRRVFLIFLVCMTLGICILLVTYVTVDFADKKKAARAYYEEDYETCYQNLVGKNLNESQQVMLGKSESILRIRLWMREYEMFVLEGAEPEALDSLLLSVRDYPKLYSYSNQWNATFEVQEIYAEMLRILEEKYGLTGEKAEEIANLKDDVVYSRIVRRIAAGGSPEDPEDPGEGASEGPAAGTTSGESDLLPEEEDLVRPDFAGDDPGR